MNSLVNYFEIESNRINQKPRFTACFMDKNDDAVPGVV